MGGTRRGARAESFELVARRRRFAPGRETQNPHAQILMSDTSSQPVKKILFVDDNVQFLEMIERLMGAWSRGEWQIFLAQNSGKALLILQENPIDLAVVDVQMPVVDGIQFLALLNRKYPGVQKVTLSAYADDASRTACLSQGAELFLEKPRDPADLELIFTTLRELARHKPTT